MRGQVPNPVTGTASNRITPADAGTRTGYALSVLQTGDHPRGCGDKLTRKNDTIGLLGSPPRMRGQGASQLCVGAVLGITPADAGTSCLRSRRRSICEDHPRGCGDKGPGSGVLCSTPGSPPRMRGQAAACRSLRSGCRITPADAGTSLREFRLRSYPQDHPRGCGDKP